MPLNDEEDAEMGYAVARERIATTRRERANELYLSDLALRAVPPEIESLCDCLTKLDLCNNQLESTELLARAISPLVGLTELRLHRNQLQSNECFAKAISPLVHLTDLTLFNNQIESNGALTLAMSQLVRLTHLDLSGNPLGLNDAFVDALSPLVNMKHLFLSQAGIQPNKFLAMALSPMTELMLLDLSNNQISSSDSLVQTLLPLARLTRLYLAHNQLVSNSALLHALSPLSQLVSINLLNNRLESNNDLAQVLSPLINLTDLDLGFNRLEANGSVEQALSSLVRLEWLNLESNQLASNKSLAVAISPLNKLKYLNLNHNKIESNNDLVKTLSGLTQLTTLDLGYNQIISNDELARALSPLVGLTSLNLGYNQLESSDALARALSPLVNLVQLGMYNNRIESNYALVRALSPLVRLTHLGINENLTRISSEVLSSRDFGRILRTIHSIAAGSSSAVLEFKAVILGEGRIGKTQLRHRLMGEQAVENEPPTHSFEWCVLPWEAKYMLAATGGGVSASAGQVLRAKLHLFDFGGQQRLMASHRFFLSHRRTFYIVCVDATKPIRETRLEYWLKFVEDLWQAGTRSDARRACDRLGEDADDLRAFDDELSRRQAAFPRPPVVMVVTRSRHPSRKRLLDLAAVEGLCQQYGALLVEDYDSFDPAHPDVTLVESVREKIEAATQDVSLGYVWTDQFARESLELRSSVREAVGFDATGLNPRPRITRLTVEAFLSTYAGIGPDVPKKDPRRLAAMDGLADLRDMGIVHWLGDRTDLSDGEDRLRSVIFSPAWVRGPIYRVLWAEDPVAKPLGRERLEKLLRGDALAGDPELSTDEVADLIALMIKCELVFESRDANGARWYFVPDRLEPGDEKPLIAGDGGLPEGEHGYKLDLGFVPDSLMPRLIGKLTKLYKCTGLTRCSAVVEWGTVGATKVMVKACASQAEGVVRVAIASGEPTIRSKVLVALHTMIGDALDRYTLPEFVAMTRDKLTRKAATEQKIAVLSQGVPGLITQIRGSEMPDASEIDKAAPELKAWLEVVDACVENEMPYRMAVLAGLCRAMKGKDFNFSLSTVKMMNTIATWAQVVRIEAGPWLEVLKDASNPKKKETLGKALGMAIHEMKAQITKHAWLSEAGKSADSASHDEKQARKDFKRKQEERGDE